MRNRKQRLEHLEGGRRGRGIPIIIVKHGETDREAWQKHLAQHPEDEKAKMRIVIKGSVDRPDSKD